VTVLKEIPDLVLCDVGLPAMSGFELLERLIELTPRLGRHSPFVFVTALCDRGSELRGRRLGADDYVTKPIDFDILETIIKARLAGVARTEVRPKPADLSDREMEMLTWVARGKTSAQIAGMLGLAKRTVDFHLDNAQQARRGDPNRSRHKRPSGGLSSHRHRVPSRLYFRAGISFPARNAIGASIEPRTARDYDALFRVSHSAQQSLFLQGTGKTALGAQGAPVPAMASRPVATDHNPAAQQVIGSAVAVHGLVAMSAGGPALSGTAMIRPGSGAGAIGGPPKAMTGVISGANIRMRHP
jgi:FixJ family two-component response regulator